MKRLLPWIVAVWCLFFGAQAQAASFDCAKASTKVEKLICADETLSTLDDNMAAAYRQAKNDLHNAPWFREQHRLWLRARNVCGPDRSCLEESYKKRLEGLKWYEATCKLPDYGEEIYRYELEVNNDATVCQHMGKVYNAYFRQPWKHHGSGSKEYEEGGLYTFPKLPGVEHSARAAFAMRYSKWPSSPEFDAVPWREGQSAIIIPPGTSLYNSPPDKVQYSCVLIADFDIDNDGRVETVVKDDFMGGGPQTEFHSGDSFSIFTRGSIDPATLTSNDRFSQYRTDGIQPRHLAEFMARPFIFNGRTYLSGYRPWWKIAEDGVARIPSSYGYPDREFTEVFRYRGGGEHVPEGRGYGNTPLQMDLVCRFRMKIIKQSKQQ
ncbi:MAG: hypothetical protein OEV89_07980 [Desulfobulbaceae bacterium]|nr:hypothetical protein [Desulfobulbaceae bacterium]HIJ90692.1 hypothetical protein [Deltaproteobacteria bacterium]